MYTLLSTRVRAVRVSNVRTGGVLSTYESVAARRRFQGRQRRAFTGGRARARTVTRQTVAAHLSARPCPP